MSEPFIGEIRMVGFNFPPRGWSTCEGQLLPISQNTALFSLLGTTYGGDGRTTFGLPDLRGRVPIGQGQGPGLTPRPWGQRSGFETNTLNVNQLPPHNHVLGESAHMRAHTGEEAEGGTADTGSSLGQGTPIYSEEPTTVAMRGNTVGGNTENNGGGQPVNNIQPYLVIYFVIALVGLFPSRS